MLKFQTYLEPLLTHAMTPVGPVPTAQDPDGVYPYESYSETSHRPELKEYRMIALENEQIRVVVSPDLGGRVYSLTHKHSGKETVYTAPLVRPSRILPRQSFIGGGIEVSFPISHTPVLLEKVSHRIKEDDRIYLWCGEREIRFGMQWTVEYSLGLNDHFLTQRTCFHNPTDKSHPWMSWSNAGVPAADDTEFHFPGGPVLYHGEEMRIIDWKTEGPRRQSDMKRMAGYFWRDPDCNAFGAYTPSLGCGLYHIADPKLTPGIKLWTDGVGEQKEFMTQITLNGHDCIEIQAGPIIDQSIKNELAPDAYHYHIEFWIPTDKPLDIYNIAMPAPDLLPLDQIPLFDFARPEATIWLQVLDAFDSGMPEKLPSAPGLTDNRWAPSGMGRLEQALRWASDTVSGDEADRWLFQLGAWYAGSDRIKEALEALNISGDDRAKALSARLYRRNLQEYAKAAECYRGIRSRTFALHPQIVFERDLTLAMLSIDTIEERANWLDETKALKDEWLIERRVSLLVDQDRLEAAKHLIETTNFQLIHQRYARTRLWKKIMERLGLPAGSIPLSLGEDDLFEFGAYREYQEDEK